MRIVHDLPRALSSGGDTLPRTITAEATPNPAVSSESSTITSTAHEDGSGVLRVAAQADLDDSKTSALEKIEVDSRWRADGSGRADVAIAGGDVAADDLGVVSAVECCWGADFTRSYYSDSIGIEAVEGDAAACVYEAA